MHSQAAEIHYFNTQPDELRRLFEALPSPYLGMSLDIGHLNLLDGVGADEILDAFPTRIANAGMSDNFGETDGHIALGDGSLDVVAALQALASRGHRVPVVVEVPSQYRVKSLGYLRQRLRSGE